MKEQNTNSGALWLLFGGRQLLEKNAIDLLRSIDKQGSITRAAKEVGISYKTAWDHIDRLNNASSKPLVTASTGGKHGGGCRLSEYGKRILDAYDLHQKRFESAVDAFSGKKGDFDFFADFARSLILKTSARNQFSGIIEKVVHGPVSAEVVLRISERDTVTAVITNESAKALRLKKGAAATALIKAPSVILMIDDGKAKTSAMNRLCGSVDSVIKGTVNNEIKVGLTGGKSLIATITKESSDDMKLAKGVEVCALFNASQVILAITE
jgi:molybdate transport system regulatory protein